MKEDYQNALKKITSFFLKITSENLCKPIYDIINYSTFTCPFESGQCGKEGKKLQKFEYLENEKGKIKDIFHTFCRSFT